MTEADLDLSLSNPVLVVERILDELQRDPRAWARHPGLLDPLLQQLGPDRLPLPRHRLEAWQRQGHVSAEQVELRAEPEPPGVLGLILDLRADCALVTRIRCQPGEEWDLAPSLPFGEAELEQLLLTTLRGGRLPIRSLPEGRAFVMREQLGHRPMGRSMHLAGLLAMIAAAQPHPHPLLSAAVVVVEAREEQLVAVDHAQTKLAAFEREIGKGSLLIAHPECEAARLHSGAFEECWWVRDFADLARHLDEHRLLVPFLAETRLDAQGFDRIHRRARTLNQELAFDEARDLARRALHCADASGLAPRRRDELRRELLIACRNLGHHEEALDEARELGRDLRAREARLSHDALARADCELAACLFLPHRFAEVLETLRPHLERIRLDPMSLDPETRVRIQNTAARAHIALDQPDWEPLLDASLALQREVDPDNALRTENYRIEGLLRAHRHDEAQALLGTPRDERGHSRWLRASYRAALAAARGQVWQDDNLHSVAGVEPNPVVARYLHQCAMQTSRSLLDRQGLIARARGRLAAHLSRQASTNILQLANHGLALQGATLRGSSDDWNIALRALHTFLTEPELAAASAYYDSFIPRSSLPDPIAVHELLHHLVIF